MAGKKGMHDKHRFSEDYINKLRAKIDATKLLNRLQSHIVDNQEMTATQVQAALGLLRKVMPELQSTELNDKREGWADVLKRIQEVSKVEPETVSDQPQVH
jgi:uncharacterized membrane protein